MQIISVNNLNMVMHQHSSNMTSHSTVIHQSSYDGCAVDHTCCHRQSAVGCLFVMQALLGGHATWGSWPEVSGLFSEDCHMVTHDCQEFTGKAAIIRRLNKGKQGWHSLCWPTVASGLHSERSVSTLQLHARGTCFPCALFPIGHSDHQVVFM